MTDQHTGGVPLSDLVTTLRSKNAGVDHVTFDLFFTGPRAYRRVVADAQLDEQALAELYGIDPEVIVTYVPMPQLNALKFTFRRPRPSGGPGDADLFGSQQYAPLLTFRIK